LNRLKVSVITACLNSAKTIEQTIQSVIGQSYPDIEYIIVDGGSTDGTLQIVERYRNRIAKVISEKDEGVYDAFNKGVRAATGDVIYFLNSDDYLYNDKAVEKVASAFLHSEIPPVAVYGNILRINDQNGYVIVLGQELTLDKIRQGKKPMHPAFFVRRELFERYNYFDLRYRIASDYDFMIKVFKDYAERTRYIDEIIAVFRSSGISRKLSNFQKIRKETVSILNRHFENHSAREYRLDEINQMFYKKWLEILLYKQTPASKTPMERRNIRDVALFGSMEMSLLVLKDLQQAGVAVHAFLDNNERRQGLKMCDVPIVPVEWLRDHLDRISAVVFAFEGDHEEAVKRQVSDMIAPRTIPFLSWKDFVSESLEEM